MRITLFKAGKLSALYGSLLFSPQKFSEPPSCMYDVHHLTFLLGYFQSLPFPRFPPGSVMSLLEVCSIAV